MTIDKDIIKQSFKDYQECEPVDGGGFTVEPMNKCITQAHLLPPSVALYPDIVLEGDLCIIFGQSGIGKTIFAMQIARHIAENDKRVLYVDCEMTPLQLGNRYETANFRSTFLRAEMDREHPAEDILKGIEEVAVAMQNASAIIEQNKQLQKENGRLTEENDVLRKRIDSLDENAITRLRDKTDAEIKELQEQLGKAESEAIRSGNKAYSERQRAENAEKKLREMLGITEIKEIWESIQQNKEAFRKQIDKWIEDGVAAIKEYADGKDNDFQPKQGNSVAWGIIAEAFKYGLDPTDEKQRRMATAYLLEKVSWTGMSEFKAGLTASRIRQLCDVLKVSKDLMATLLLAAGGRGGISTGGGGSNGELANWDGTKKNTGWGR